MGLTRLLAGQTNGLGSRPLQTLLRAELLGGTPSAFQLGLQWKTLTGSQAAGAWWGAKGSRQGAARRTRARGALRLPWLGVVAQDVL